MTSDKAIIFNQILNSLDEDIRKAASVSIKILLDNPDIIAKRKSSPETEEGFAHLSDSKEHIVQNFRQQINLILSGKIDLDETDELSSSLSLVDDSALSESIQLHDLCKGLADQNSAEITAIKKGIIRTSQDFANEAEPKAIQPRLLFDVWHNMLLEQNISKDVRTPLFAQLRDVLEKELPDIYGKLLFILEHNNILSSFENPSSKSYDLNHKNLSKKSLIKTQTLSAELDQLDETIQHELYNDDPDEDFDGEAIPIAKLKPSTLNYGGNTVVSRLLYQYLSSKTPEGGDTKSSGKPISDQSLIEHLSEIQRDTVQLDYFDASHDNLDLHSQIQEAIGDHSLTPTQLNTANLIKKLFDAISDDTNIDILVTNEITRLQVPYLKVALLDISILKHTQHPARKVLNLLAEIGLPVDDEQDPNFTWIQTIIKFILNKFDENLDVFENILEKVTSEQHKLKAEAKKRSDSAKSVAKKEAKKRFLKKRVLDELHGYIANKQLPRQIYELVLKGFTPLFLQLHVKAGKDSKQWHSAIHTFRKIIESVQPQTSVYSLKRILKQAPGLLGDAQKLLAKVLQKEDQRDLLNGLKYIYKKRAEEYKRRRPEMEKTKDDGRDPLSYAHANPDITIEGDSDSSLETEHLAANAALVKSMPEEAKEGAMCEVYLGKQLGTRRLKILSISEETAQVIFIDGTGTETRIKDVKSFINELECERSQVIPQDKLFDKALSTVLLNIEIAKQKA